MGGTCEMDGECVPIGGCKRFTGGSCNVLQCHMSRGAICVSTEGWLLHGHHCVCALNECSYNGKCIPTFVGFDETRLEHFSEYAITPDDSGFGLGSSHAVVVFVVFLFATFAVRVLRHATRGNLSIWFFPS